MRHLTVHFERCGATLRDLVALARPRLLAEAMLVVAAAYVVARPEPFGTARFIVLLLGGALVLSGASALNQLLERGADARMRRTMRRPLPAHRLGVLTAGAYGAGLCLLGTAALLLGVGGLAAAVALAGLAIYLLGYTPLKRRSPAAIPVGAAAGAIPALMGWAAATGAIEAGALALFFIVFLWQLPHFLAIGWIYRRDYEAAGFRIVPGGGGDGAGAALAKWVLLANVLLLAISLLPAALGLSGRFYVVGAALLGSVYLMAVYSLTDGQRSPRWARRLLRVSVAYLPALLLVLALDRWLW